MERRTQALFGLGGLALVGSIPLGAPWTGYGMGVAPLLFRVGIIYVLLGAVTARAAPVTIRQAIGTAIGTLVVSFLVGTGTMHYEFGVTPPEYGTPLTVSLLVQTQAEIALLLTPVPVGYVCGVLFRHNQPSRSLGLFGSTLLGGWFAATTLTYTGGTQAEFASLYYALVILGAGVAALPLLKLMSQQANSHEPPTREHPST